MFLGSYEYSIDDKGRLVIPSKFRNEIGDKLYLMKGFDGCLSIYKDSDFQKAIENLQKFQYEKEKTRLYQRLLLETVVELTIDKLGRIQIPQKTLQKYCIGKEVKIIGLLDHFEVWDQSVWEKYHDDHIKDFEHDAEDLLKDEK
jgi:mraZ protein